MRKITFFLMITLIAFIMACNKDKVIEEPKPIIEDGAYFGLMIVNENTPAEFKDSVKITVEIIDNETLTMELSEVRFAERMPAMNITVKGIDIVEVRNDYLLSGDKIIPFAMIAGKLEPFENFIITDMTGTLTALTLEFSMKCGDYPVKYSGKMTTVVNSLQK